jgi:hypothetical protein
MMVKGPSNRDKFGQRLQKNFGSVEGMDAGDVTLIQLIPAGGGSDGKSSPLRIDPIHLQRFQCTILGGLDVNLGPIFPFYA